MSPTPIKSVGKVRPEVVVEPAKERDSLAYNMAISGDSFSAEHIAMIDAKVKSGELSDDLAQEIKAEIGNIIGGQDPYTYQEFIGALAGAAADVAADEGFRSSFDFQKKGFDSIRDKAAKSRREGKPRKVLSEEDKRAFDMAIAKIGKDPTMDKEAMLRDEVDRALIIVRRKTLNRLGIQDRSIGAQQSLGQMIPGIEPLEVSGDEEDLDSPGDFHMNLDALDKTILDLAVGGQECKCGKGDSCCSKGDKQ